MILDFAMKKLSSPVLLQTHITLNKQLLHILLLFGVTSTFSSSYSSVAESNYLRRLVFIPGCRLINQPRISSNGDSLRVSSAKNAAARKRLTCSTLRSRHRNRRRISATNINDGEHSFDHRRRNLLRLTNQVIIACGVAFLNVNCAEGRGLVQFPCPKGLSNSYHFLRVGTTLLEQEGMWSTNPLFLTNREDALSETGAEQIVDVCRKLSSNLPTVVKYSLAASCIDTADIVQRELKLGRERIIPEFTFLDPRAIGKWDMMSKIKVEPAVWALDHDTAGIEGLEGRPPENDDGTPNETLADQATRLRQLMSILESQYSGDTILLIFPDGTGPALLSAMIAGIPYNRVHQLEFSPGEIRFDVTYQSTRKLWNAKQTLTNYDVILAEGRKTLPALLVSDPERIEDNDFVNLKDAKLEKERIEIEATLESKARERKLAQAELDRIRQERKNYIEQNKTSDSFAISPTLISFGGLLTASVIMLGANQKTSVGSDSNNLSVVNETDRMAPNTGSTGDNTSAPNLLLDNLLYQRELVNGDFNASMPLLVKLADPRAAAKQAMQEYMDRDDGGEDWIRVMNEIIHEPDFETDEIGEGKTAFNKSSFQ